MRLINLCLLSILSSAGARAELPDRVPLAQSAVAAPESRCELAVTVGSLRKSGEQYRGQVCYTIFKGKEGFPDKSELAYANQCVLVQQSATLSFMVKDLPCDNEYALAMLHDENMNRQLDRTIGVPAEGIGMSNNPSFVRVNAPPFDDVKFKLQPPRASQVINIHYF